MWGSKIIVAVIGGALLAGVGVGWHADGSRAIAQAPATPGAPPFDLSNPNAINEGAQQFSRTCTGYCHGKEGGPARAPKLRGQKLEQSYVYGRIMKGSPNGMPAFESTLPQEKIWQLVAYILSLSKAEDK
jgi:mono/diheme cytochrome c family protein